MTRSMYVHETKNSKELKNLTSEAQNHKKWLSKVNIFKSYILKLQVREQLPLDTKKRIYP